MADVKLDHLNSVQGADIEIIDRSAGTLGVVLPNAVRINGTEVLIPSDATISISEITEDELVTVTLTMFVRSLSIRREPVELAQP